jgi:hypothetical protein
MSLDNLVRHNRGKRVLGSNLVQLSGKQVSPVPDLSLANDNNTKDRVTKLDRQVADLKRKHKSSSCPGSPRKIHKTLIAGTERPFEGASPHKGNDLAVRTHSAGSSISTASPQSSALPRKLKNQITRSQLKSTLSSSFDNSFDQNSIIAVNSPSKMKLIRTKSELIALDTQIIDSSESFMKSTHAVSRKQRSRSESPGKSSQTRPKKAGSVNMFDSIPQTTGEEEVSVEIPDSSQSSKGERKDLTITYDHMFSSPIKNSVIRQKKQVAFSSDIESSAIMSSPIKTSSAERKSILKLASDADREHASQQSIDDILKLDLGKNESWPSGFVLLMPLEYPDLGRVILQCSKGLIDNNFKKHYQVYASFNELLKRSPRALSTSVFTKEVMGNIVSSVKNEIRPVVHELKDGLSPFKLRTTSQALKLLAALNMMTVDMKEMTFIYDTCLKLLKNENLTKSLATPIFQLIRMIPEHHTERIEALTVAIIQMKFFQSCSVICEKLNILRRFIMDSPAVMNKCSYQVLSYVLYSIINTDVPGYSKVLFSAISVLTCVSRNSESKFVIVKLLSEELEDSFSSLNSIQARQSEDLNNVMNISQALCDTLKYLLHVQFYTQTAKIWSYVTYMVSFNRRNFLLENWTLFPSFKSVYVQLYSSPEALSLSLEAWKSVVYNFQMILIKDWRNEQLRDSLDFVFYPFSDVKVQGNWTTHPGYVMLYCRIFYTVRLRMEEPVDEERLQLLLESMLKPLLQLKKWDSTFEFILQMIFTSDRYVYNEPAESCFWLSDLEKWRSRILPIRKSMLKNPRTYETILRSLDSVKSNDEVLIKFLEIAVYHSLESLKLGSSRRDYSKVGSHIVDWVADIIGELESADIETCFGLIQNIDEELLFTRFEGKEYALVRIINAIKSTGPAYLQAFISRCKERYDELKTFAICLLSDIYSDPEIVKSMKEQKIPYFLESSEDFKELELAKTFKLADDDQVKVSQNMLNMFRFTADESNYRSKYAELTDLIVKSNLLQVLKTQNKYNLLVDLQTCCGRDVKLFCDATSTDLLEHAFEYKEDTVATGRELISVLQYFKDLESISFEWLASIGTKLNYLLHPEIVFEEWLLHLTRAVVGILPAKTVNKLKKLVIKRKVENLIIFSLLDPETGVRATSTVTPIPDETTLPREVTESARETSAASVDDTLEIIQEKYDAHDANDIDAVASAENADESDNVRNQLNVELVTPLSPLCVPDDDHILVASPEAFHIASTQVIAQTESSPVKPSQYKAKSSSDQDDISSGKINSLRDIQLVNVDDKDEDDVDNISIEESFIGSSPINSELEVSPVVVSSTLETDDTMNENECGGKVDGGDDDNVIDGDTDTESSSQNSHDVHVSPARRTRSRTSVLDFEILDESKVKKIKKLHQQKKKERREQKRREKRERKSKQPSIEVEELEKFRELLTVMNKKSIKLEKLDKEELEKDLVTLLMKLKQS